MGAAHAPTVVVVSTGGTIAMRPDPASGKLVPAVSGDELVEMLEWPEAPAIELDDFAQVPSFDVHGELALGLARRVGEHAAGGTPTVVTHGTDTMEESAYLADLLLPEEAAPVVFTGAQRGAEERDADGPRNLRDAITIALAEDAAGRGVLVSFAGEVHAAREARKVHTSALRAFASPGYGPLGHVDAGAVRFRRRPVRRAAAAGARAARARRPDPPARRQRRALPAHVGRVRRSRHRARGHRPRQRERPGRGGRA